MKRLLRLHTVVLLGIALVGTAGCFRTDDPAEIRNAVRLYNRLAAEGYRSQNMNPLQQVTTGEQALKLYHHMAALGEGRLRMESRLKDLRFQAMERRSAAQANVETEEIWDFTHYRMDGGAIFAQERDFIYRVGYVLEKQGGRWIITNVTTISGTSTNSVVPWPMIDRKGRAVTPVPCGREAGGR